MRLDTTIDHGVSSPTGGNQPRPAAHPDSPPELAVPETIQPWTGSALGAGRARGDRQPRVDYLATGGTIATVPGDHASASGPTLTAQAIARSVPG
ncbi:MAG: hypothetical protein ACRDPA_05690, partial [Solirubrobacteraceae bacterium]